MTYEARRLRDEILAIGQMAADQGGLELAHRYLNDPLGKERLLAELGRRAGRIERKKSLLRTPAVCRGLPLAHLQGDDDYSLADLIRRESESRAAGRATPGAGLEREIDLELRRAQNWSVPLNGTIVPFDVFGEQRRDFSVGTPSQAGNLVGSTPDLGRMPLIFETGVLGRLGATIVTGLNETLVLPRLQQRDIAEPNWVSETGAAPEILEETSAADLSPRRISATFIFSLQAMRQGGPAFESVLRREIGGRLVSQFEAAVFGTADGSGAAPAGLLSAPGNVHEEVGGTNGARLSSVHLADMVYYASQTTGSLPDRAGWAFNPRTLGWLRSELVDTGYFNFDTAPGKLWGYPIAATVHLSEVLTKGSASNCSGLAFSSDWSQLVIALYGPGVDLVVDKVTMADTGQVKVHAGIYVGVGLNMPGAFSVMSDALLPTT